MKKSKYLLLSIVLLFSNPVFAFRCGHDLVDIGDYKEDVVDKCGEPKSIETHIERRGASNSVGQSRYFGNSGQLYPRASVKNEQQQYVEIEVVVEEWIYNFGRRRFQKYLRFENGRLIDIKNLRKGY